MTSFINSRRSLLPSVVWNVLCSRTQMSLSMFWIVQYVSLCSTRSRPWRMFQCNKIHVILKKKKYKPPPSKFLSIVIKYIEKYESKLFSGCSMECSINRIWNSQPSRYKDDLQSKEPLNLASQSVWGSQTGFPKDTKEIHTPFSSRRQITHGLSNGQTTTE